MRIFTHLQMLMKILYAHFGLTTILRKSSLARRKQDIYNRTDSRRYKLQPFLVPTLRKTLPDELRPKSWTQSQMQWEKRVIL